MKATRVMLMLALVVCPARADTAPTHLRLAAGGAGALDPAFAAANLGADWFFSPAFAVGVQACHTLPSAGDQRAIEDGYGFFTALARLRPPTAGRLRAEVLGGAGVARIQFGRPGAHIEYAPDVAWGAGLAWPLTTHAELAVEFSNHVTFGARTGTRNTPHTSELLALVLRWGGP